MASLLWPILDQVTKVGGTVIGIITASSLQGPCGRLADYTNWDRKKHRSPMFPMFWWYFMWCPVLNHVKPMLWGLPGRKWSRQIHTYIYIHMWNIIVRSCIRIYTYTIHLPSHDPSHAEEPCTFLQLFPLPFSGILPALCCSCLPALCAYKCSHACGLGPKFLIQGQVLRSFGVTSLWGLFGTEP